MIVLSIHFYKHNGLLFNKGVWRHSIFVPDGLLKNATHASPGHPVEFNQSDDDFETLEVFPILCAISIRSSANVGVGVTSEAETTEYPISWNLMESIDHALLLGNSSITLELVDEELNAPGVMQIDADAELGLHRISLATGSVLRRMRLTASVMNPQLRSV